MQIKNVLIQSSLAAVVVALVGVGYASMAGTPGTADANPDGEKIWAQTCNRCHNVRSPNTYTDAQWDVALMHMRVRANLTAEQYRLILDYLKTHN